MARYRILLSSLGVFLILPPGIAACAAKQTATPANTGPTGTVLALVGPNGGHALSMADLRALPVTEGQGGIQSSTGQITIPEPFKGVALKDLAWMPPNPSPSY